MKFLVLAMAASAVNLSRQSRAATLAKLGDEAKDIEKMTDAALKNDTVDGATAQLALEKISALYHPYHAIVGDLHREVYGDPLAGVGGLVYPGYAGLPMPKYDPENNAVDAISQEVQNTRKQLAYVRSLENRLQDKEPYEKGTSEDDWELLSRMKKDLGMKVDYKSKAEEREENRAADAGWDPETYRAMRPDEWHSGQVDRIHE